MDDEVIARRVFSAGVIGTALEWYDFILYGTASALVFATVFFPEEDPALATLAAFATFGVGFLARPLGALVFGQLGDRIGRKKVLILTLVIMGVASALMGVLPGYATVGASAPVFLVVLRLVQGFAAGAEYAGAGTMAVEFAPPKRKGIMGAAPGIGAAIGSVLSAVAFTIPAAVMPHDAFLLWGWRVPFILSVVMLGVAVYVRRRVLEVPGFESDRESGARQLPIVALMRQSPRNLVLGILASFGPNIGFYVPIVFGTSYAAQHGGVTAADLTTIHMVVYLIGIGITVFSGFLADRWTKRGTFILGALITAVSALPFFWLIESRSLPQIWAAFLLFSIGFYVMAGAQGALLASLFTRRTRFTGVAVSREFSAAIVGGTAPFIAALLVAWGGPLSVSIYAIALLVLCALAAYGTVAQDDSEHNDSAVPTLTESKNKEATWLTS